MNLSPLLSGFVLFTGLYWGVVVPAVPIGVLNVTIDSMTVSVGVALILICRREALDVLRVTYPYRYEALIFGTVVHWISVTGFRGIRIVTLDLERPGGAVYSSAFDYLSLLQILAGMLVITAFTPNSIPFLLRVWRGNRWPLLCGTILAAIVVVLKRGGV